MKKFSFFIFLLSTILFLERTPLRAESTATTAFTNARAQSQTKSCPLKSTAILGVTIPNTYMELEEATSYVNKVVEKINGYAKELGIEDIQISMMNYSIRSASQSYHRQQMPSDKKGMYNISGSLSLALNDNKKATELMQKIGDEFVLNLQVSARLSCN